MTALVAADPVVRLPGSVARWNEQRVREAIGNQQVRILVAPPGLDKDVRDRVRDVKNATLRVIGTEVSGGLYQAVADDLPGWRAQFATGDVTDLRGLTERVDALSLRRVRARVLTACQDRCERTRTALPPSHPLASPSHASSCPTNRPDRSPADRSRTRRRHQQTSLTASKAPGGTTMRTR
ncbi:hypothetical protein [Micromonospora sp. MW-13]|uniref:hypothetical protein n=1 Tax=Micromonospora sp. MW-13 TaxID=2094022 RepID=UPI001FB55DDA|nr:hypothetical protein [Micromonospora sp. MW-13]